jgi:hypothetical protein
MKSNTPTDDLSFEFVSSKLSYDPLSGELRWLRPKGGKARPGAIAGCWHGGYRRVKIGPRSYMASRLAWLLHHGEWPGEDFEMDHINLNRSDDRMVNLRKATKNQNMQNVPVRRNGLKGASFKKGVWRSRITHDGVHYLLGTYATEQEAHDAYVKAAKQLHAEFARAK